MPSEGPVEGLSGQRFGVPRPAHHGAGLSDLDDIGEWFMGDRVVFGGWDEDPSVGSAGARMRPSRNPVTKAPTVGPVDRV